MPDPEIRPLTTLDELRAASSLWDEVWSESRIVTVELLRALATHGNPVLGAFLGGELVGAQMAFLGRDGEETVLHSHVTGIQPDLQHAGIGASLKWAQRDWALAHGIETVTWTFDPMLARNAYFNLHKLGARAEQFHRAFYGEMRDAFNAGERTDRLEVVWRLRDPRVEAAARGELPSHTDLGAVLVLRDEGGRPVATHGTGDLVAVTVPADYLGLRERDREAARAWRDAVADVLEDLLGRGYRATGFLRGGAYLLERA